MTTKKTTKTKPMKKTVKKMTASEKRIAIAKDTIKWLNTKAIKASPGFYFHIPGNGIKIKNYNENFDVIFKNATKLCMVCALGGMFYSIVRRFDNVTADIGYIHNRKSGSYLTDVLCQDIYKQLRKYFSIRQLVLIEDSFEEHDGISVNDWKKSGGCINEPKRRSKPPAVRMRMIMENIVKNKGVFKPT